MHSRLSRLFSSILMLVILTASCGSISATAPGITQNSPATATVTYYVSPSGNDAAAGTSASAPFRSLAKAISKLTAGTALTLLPGVYAERLLIKQSGTGSAPITVTGSAGAIIDMLGADLPGIDLKGAWINVSGLEVRNSGGICVNLAGSNQTVSGLTVHDCVSHGIHVTQAAHVKVLGSNVYNTVLENAARNLTSGWSSAIKVRESTDVLIQGNTVHNNYGEGMGTRGTDVTIRGNTVYDNFSVNIYTNSENATIERNFVYCTGNMAFYRNNTPAGGIVMAEEYFDGWGARLKNARVTNNIVVYCKNGVRYDGADPALTGGGLKSAVIAHNTLYGSVEAALSIMYAPAQSGNLIADNILWQATDRLASIESGTGLTFQNNLWKSTPPAIAQGAGDRTGDPGFVSTPGFDPNNYKLKSGSLAIGAAANVGVTTDYFGAARSLPYDIGALEAGSAAQPTIAPTIASTPAPTPTKQAPVSGGVTYDDKSSAFSYSAGWNTITSGSAHGGSYRQTQTNGAAAGFAFTGTSFSLLYKGGPSYVSMDVFVDGARVGTINQRRDVSTYNLRWDVPGTLPAGAHTVQFVFVTTTKSNYGSVDAVIVR